MEKPLSIFSLSLTKLKQRCKDVGLIVKGRDKKAYIEALLKLYPIPKPEFAPISLLFKRAFARLHFQYKNNFIEKRNGCCEEWDALAQWEATQVILDKLLWDRFSLYLIHVQGRNQNFVDLLNQRNQNLVDLVNQLFCTTEWEDYSDADYFWAKLETCDKPPSPFVFLWGDNPYPTRREAVELMKVQPLLLERFFDRIAQFESRLTLEERSRIAKEYSEEALNFFTLKELRTLPFIN